MSSTLDYLRSLPAIRERCSRVHSLAQRDKLQFFEYHPEKEDYTIEFCLNIIKRDYGSKIDSIPPHGRWRHLDAGKPRIEPLVEKWKEASPAPTDKEICKRLIDLFLVSVLLDAGAGNVWKYKEPGTTDEYSRSEGLGVASFHMFDEGFFSGDKTQPHRVDAEGLSRITPEKVGAAMQVSDANPMNGLGGRANLLSKLAIALRENPEYFGNEARPGNLVDYLEKNSTTNDGIVTIPIASLWNVLIVGLNSIWPTSRTTLNGIPCGDVWPCPVLTPDGSKEEGDNFVPFHKLTGWTTYSLLEALQKVMKWNFSGLEHLTGLPEYRNGGLLIDTGVLRLRQGVIPKEFYPDSASTIPRLPPSHPAIVEWRAMTVIELDRIAEGIRSKLGLSPEQLTLAQVLESATWKGGREIAALKRPETKGPPIDIESDGTVF